MTHRKLMYAGAASATIALCAGSALAQIGQQPQPQRPSPIQVSPVNGKDFLKDLEGEWNVRVSIYDMDALEGKTAGKETGTASGLQTFQTIFEQALIRGGVDSDEARSEARDFVQSIERERPDVMELREKIQEAMEDAGVSEEIAQREAQRLAPQLHLYMRQQQQPGVGQPGQPGQPDRPGVQPDRPGVAIQREAQYSAEGTATRSWTLNDTFLQEELTFSVESNGDESGIGNPQHEPGRGSVNLRNGDKFEGMALLAFEPANGDLCIVWADNTKSMLHYGIGKYDTAQQAMVFHTINPQHVQLPGTPARPGVTPSPRPAPGGPQDLPGQQPDRPGQPGQPDRPGVQPDRPGVATPGDRLRLEQEGARIVLRVISDDEHTVTVYRSNPGGPAARVMEITYTRDNGNDNDNDDDNGLDGIDLDDNDD